MSQESSNHEEFEAWFSDKYPKCIGAIWKPELNRYTTLTEKQNMWETWNAARGITYVFNHGYEDGRF